MKKILIILLCLPIIGFGQDKPLLEKNVINKSIERYEKKIKDKKLKKKKKAIKKNNKLLNMEPRNGIGYIANFGYCPFGLNFYGYFNNILGYYIDYRTDFGVYAPGEWGLRDKDWIVNDMGGVATGNLSEGGYNVFNGGISINIAGTQYSSNIVYAGYGISTLKLYEEYDETYTGPYYTRSGSEQYGNINFGFLRQNDFGLYWQVGFDTTVPGINFGIGFTWL